MTLFHVNWQSVYYMPVRTINDCLAWRIKYEEEKSKKIEEEVDKKKKQVQETVAKTRKVVGGNNPMTRYR